MKHVIRFCWVSKQLEDSERKQSLGLNQNRSKCGPVRTQTEPSEQKSELSINWCNHDDQGPQQGRLSATNRLWWSHVTPENLQIWDQGPQTEEVQGSEVYMDQFSGLCSGSEELASGQRPDPRGPEEFSLQGRGLRPADPHPEDLSWIIWWGGPWSRSGKTSESSQKIRTSLIPETGLWTCRPVGGLGSLVPGNSRVLQKHQDTLNLFFKTSCLNLKTLFYYFRIKSFSLYYFS